MIHKTHWEGKPTLETLTGNHRAKIIICIITQNPWEIGFELLQHTTKSFSERSFFWFYQEHGTENNLESSSGVEPQTFRFPLWCSTTESQRLCCELNYYEVHMWDASSKVGLLELKAFLKANQSPLSHLIHLTDPSSIKQQSLYECGFSRVNMGRDTNISDFWHILLSKKGDTVTNVYSHAYWTNWQWFSMVCILINNDYSLSQWSTFAADSCSPARWVSKNFWALWWQTSLPIRLQTTLSHYQFFFSVDASSVACAIINNKNWPIRLQHYCWLWKKILENTHGIQ